MAVTRPGLDDIARIARELGAELSGEELHRYGALVAAAFASYDRLDEMAPAGTRRVASRHPGRRPSADENGLNAWSWRCSITAARDGPLCGKRIAVKDNIAVAGLPMATAVPIPRAFVPEQDATVVRRCLDAGAEIVGKASVAKSSPAAEAVRNPHDLARFSGGSSGGSAVLVATGQCDLSIGTDQGGSIRIPSAWCGVYGLKPTYGLVPYTGIVPMELTLDHVGPIATTVADLALLLEVLAGEDGVDPRQNGVCVAKYRDSLDRGVAGIRIGVLAEGFGLLDSEPDVEEVVRSAVRAFGGLGARLRDVSLPAHRDGVHLFHAIHREGMAALLGQDSNLIGWKGSDALWTALTRAFALGPAPATLLPEGLRVPAIAGAYMRRRGAHYYAKAQALGRELAAEYDALFEDVDVLVMPTLPQKPPLLEGTGGQLRKGVESAFSNMSPFNVTGHPALNVPCGRIQNLPVGMQLVGPRWREALVLQVAYAFEQLAASE